MKTLTLLAFAIVTIFFISSCSKDGAVGPEGPSGTNGTNGNANVKTMTFTVTTWSSNSNYYYVFLTDTNITSSILNSGAVEVFWHITGTTWNPVPWRTYNPANYTLLAQASLGQVAVYWTYDGGTINQSFNSYWSVSTFSVKVVCIAGSAMKRHPETNWNNYSELQKAVSIE